MEETFVLEQVLESLHRCCLHSPARYHRQPTEPLGARVTLCGNGRNGLPKGPLKAAAVPSVCLVCLLIKFSAIAPLVFAYSALSPQASVHGAEPGINLRSTPTFLNLYEIYVTYHVFSAAAQVRRLQVGQSHQFTWHI